MLLKLYHIRFQETIFLYGSFAVLSRCTAIVLAELTTEMFDIVVATAFSNFLNGFICIFELVLGKAESSFNDIVHTRETK